MRFRGTDQTKWSGGNFMEVHTLYASRRHRPTPAVRASHGSDTITWRSLNAQHGVQLVVSSPLKTTPLQCAMKTGKVALVITCCVAAARIISRIRVCEYAPIPNNRRPRRLPPPEQPHQTIAYPERSLGFQRRFHFRQDWLRCLRQMVSILHTVVIDTSRTFLA